MLAKQSNSLRNAVKAMDDAHQGFIAIVDDTRKLCGIVTDGDFRRAILDGHDLSENVCACMQSDPVTIIDGEYDSMSAKDIFAEGTVQHIPVIDENRIVKDIIYSSDLMDQRPQSNLRDTLSIPVVIMAGGKGTRLEPFTKILPKPLIPINGKPIIQIIMDRFVQHGMQEFYLTLNYKSKMIESYFEDIDEQYNLRYIRERKPLGTAGSLKLLEPQISSTFIVSNCDIIIRSDYYDIYEFHKNKDYVLTIVGSVQHQQIPYGVCKIENGGDLREIIEKPNFDFVVNTGMYICEPDVLDVIKAGQIFHMTDVIHALRQSNCKIGVYPVSEKSWIDVGQWEEYKRAIALIQ
ncbi:Glucosamine-1-phosphate guanylyltransferase [Olavius sp. associated proteobacterium Delta 1]|nr:Glucosamine-1-phosphate guanylyltransferase [Olavius sp. associated proteobacterium Delta 1]